MEMGQHCRNILSRVDVSIPSLSESLHEEVLMHEFSASTPLAHWLLKKVWASLEKQLF